jgi:hypothetical protein
VEALPIVFVMENLLLSLRLSAFCTCCIAPCDRCYITTPPRESQHLFPLFCAVFITYPCVLGIGGQLCAVSGKTTAFVPPALPLTAHRAEKLRWFRGEPDRSPPYLFPFTSTAAAKGSTTKIPTSQ